MSTSIKPDVREDLLTLEQFRANCDNYADWAFFTPPDRFMFHHYAESADKPLVCIRPMMGIEKYEAHWADGSGFCGVYDTRLVTWYIKSGTWIVLEANEYFLKHDIAKLQQELESKLQELRAAAT